MKSVFTPQLSEEPVSKPLTVPRLRQVTEEERTTSSFAEEQLIALLTQAGMRLFLVFYYKEKCVHTGAWVGRDDLEEVMICKTGGIGMCIKGW